MNYLINLLNRFVLIPDLLFIFFLYINYERINNSMFNYYANNFIK